MGWVDLDQMIRRYRFAQIQALRDGGSQQWSRSEQFVKPSERVGGSNQQDVGARACQRLVVTLQPPRPSASQACQAVPLEPTPQFPRVVPLKVLSFMTE